MTVRFAEPEDRAAVIALMPRASLAAGFGPDGIMPLTLTRARMELLFDLHRTHPDACLIVYAPDNRPRGFLMAALFAHPFDERMRIAKDTAWWIDEDGRGRLSIANAMLDFYEDWARARGCIYSGLAGMGEAPRAGKLYRRRGYAAAETHYLKAL